MRQEHKLQIRNYDIRKILNKSASQQTSVENN
jgi:hypothetical protein